jgi:hypothetical protein
VGRLNLDQGLGYNLAFIMLQIHLLQTGLVRIKSAQRRRRLGGLARVILDRTWTEWLPIYAWAIEHPEGAIVVDTGETARTSEPDYFPQWHPYYRLRPGPLLHRDRAAPDRHST